jgi:penicillin-insensitive murein endopeptidase
VAEQTRQGFLLRKSIFFRKSAFTQLIFLSKEIQIRESESMNNKIVFNFLLLLLSAILTQESIAVAKKKSSPKIDYDSIVNTSPQNPWPKIKTPTPAPLKTVGFYTGGCFSGGQALSISGPHHEVMRSSRGRFYGHPQLLELIRSIGAASGEKILIGDMSQPRGGPTPFGHASHQLGIEADIWYQPLSFYTSSPLSDEQRESFKMTSAVSDDWKSFRPERWRTSAELAIMAAAANPQVDRIFVNAVVKRYLCEKYPDFANLNKLRPWYFHNEHFHVRMKCPAGMSECRPQAPISNDPGCGKELNWWLSNEAIAIQMNSTGDPVSRVVKIPKACREIAK